MTVSTLILRDHAVGIHVSQGPECAQNQSNGRAMLSVHLRIHCFGHVLALFGHVLALFGPVLTIIDLR